MKGRNFKRCNPLTVLALGSFAVALFLIVTVVKIPSQQGADKPSVAPSPNPSLHYLEKSNFISPSSSISPCPSEFQATSPSRPISMPYTKCLQDQLSVSHQSQSGLSTVKAVRITHFSPSNRPCKTIQMLSALPRLICRDS
jgi:hypothetical protein